MKWNSPDNLPEKIGDPVLVKVKEINGVEWQYVCWPPDEDTGWLICMPDCKQNADIDLDTLPTIKVIGWKELDK